MKEFEKIKIIEQPRQLLDELNNYDMDVLRGGIETITFLDSILIDFSCGTYTHCPGNKQTSCSSYTNGTCGSANSYCGTYKIK